jgi:peroxiredoxin Q/BCP
VEGQEFRDELPHFTAQNVLIYGVSTDSIESHCRFRDKYRFNFPLLSDPDATMTTAYGALGTDRARRSTVVIGPDGKVLRVYEKVKAAGHAKQVLVDLFGEAAVA